MTFNFRVQFLIVSAALLLVLTACQQKPSQTPLEASSVVLALGDSITYGTGAGKGEDFPTLLAQQTGWQVVNAGISGDTAQNARSRVAALLERHDPALVLVELGGNDFLRRRPEAQVKNDLRAILQELKRSGATIVLIAVPSLSMLRASIGALSDSPIYAELAEEAGILLVQDLLSEVLSDEALRADRIHPNAKGYQRMASGLADRLSSAGLLP